MAGRQEIIDVVDAFYQEIIEKYKDLERQIASESRFLGIFKKVDYKSRIGKFKELKKKAQSINIKKIEIDANDELAVQVSNKLGRSITLFNNIIDAQVLYHTTLSKKSEGIKIYSVEYRKAVYNVQKATEVLQKGLREMDADYANLEEYQ